MQAIINQFAFVSTLDLIREQRNSRLIANQWTYCSFLACYRNVHKRQSEEQRANTHFAYCNYFNLIDTQSS